MNAHFGLEAHSDPMDHDDGSDEFIIEKYRTQIDSESSPPAMSLSKLDRAIIAQFEAIKAVQRHAGLASETIHRNYEEPTATKENLSSSGDNADKQGDTVPMNDINREELDAKLSAVEARMDRRIADFQGDMRQAVSDFRLEIQPLKGMKSNIWSATAVMVGTIIAAVGLSFTAFDSGRETSALVQEAKQQSLETRQLLEQIQRQQQSPQVAPAVPSAQSAPK